MIIAAAAAGITIFALQCAHYILEISPNNPIRGGKEREDVTCMELASHEKVVVVLANHTD